MFSIGSATTGVLTKPYYSMKRNQHNSINSRTAGKAALSTKWKEDFKRSCLERARQKRYELIKSHRDVHNPNFTNIINQKHTKNDDISMPMDQSSPALARQVVEEELSKHRYQEVTAQCLQFEDENNKKENVMLTEEELLELMHEVEEELDREAEEICFEEACKVETYNEYLLEHQIADFEMWQELNTGSSHDTPFVPCPMCSMAGLTQEIDSTMTKITCNNCGFCLNRKGDVVLLEMLQERMRGLYEDHYACNTKFNFSVDADCMSDSDDTFLKARCETCGTVVTVL